MDEIEYPVDGVLDLHMFSPKDASSVVEEYLRICRDRGIFEIRIIHGKGRGILRRTAQAVLSEHHLVLDYHLDTGPAGWGVTVVHLRPDRTPHE